MFRRLKLFCWGECRSRDAMNRSRSYRRERLLSKNKNKIEGKPMAKRDAWNEFDKFKPTTPGIYFVTVQDGRKMYTDIDEWSGQNWRYKHDHLIVAWMSITSTRLQHFPSTFPLKPCKCIVITEDYKKPFIMDTWNGTDWEFASDFNVKRWAKAPMPYDGHCEAHYIFTRH